MNIANGFFKRLGIMALCAITLIGIFAFFYSLDLRDDKSIETGRVTLAIILSIAAAACLVLVTKVSMHLIEFFASWGWKSIVIIVGMAAALFLPAFGINNLMALANFDWGEGFFINIIITDVLLVVVCSIITLIVTGIYKIIVWLKTGWW